MPPYLALLRAGFCLPPVLPRARCALTAPFHPYPPSTALARPSTLGNNAYQVVSGEGGHIDFAPLNAAQQTVRDYLQPVFGRVSVERLLSGQGIENIYQALYEAEFGTAHPGLSAARVTELGLSGSDKVCVDSLNLFCEVHLLASIKYFR